MIVGGAYDHHSSVILEGMCDHWGGCDCVDMWTRCTAFFCEG